MTEILFWIVLIVAASAVYLSIGHFHAVRKLPAAWERAKTEYKINKFSDRPYWEKKRRELVRGVYLINLFWWPIALPVEKFRDRVDTVADRYHPDRLKLLEEQIRKLEQENDRLRRDQEMI